MHTEKRHSLHVLMDWNLRRVTHPECYATEGAQWPVIEDIDTWIRKYSPPSVHRVATALKKKKKDINIPALTA